MRLDFTKIKETKNLLAFSAGIDSTALFFLLVESNIPFDIAIVNYNVRRQSAEELNYAIELASLYGKEIFYKEVLIESKSNFEKTARDIRYKFFEELVSEYKYESLITAHQLNDKLEWFLMQLSKGAGLHELIGFNEVEEKENYFIFKPLLETKKDDLEAYLKKYNYKYFIDKSNYDEKYTRNYFRHNYSDKFLNEYEKGIINSFRYLGNDLVSLNMKAEAIVKIKELEIFKNITDNNLNIRIIDLSLKKRGILLSKAQRDEILKQKELVVSHKIAISISDDFIWIAPISNKDMTKEFKELCRIKKIPKNIRAYIFKENIELKDLMI